MNGTNASWNEGVLGDEALRVINTDAPILRTEAGPGTGKTFGLVRRVERILHPDGLNADGNDVLVVAFNRVIAKELRKDIERRLAAVGIEKQPVISTVHALCLQAIDEDLRLLLPHEREAMLYDVLNLYPDFRETYGPRAFDGVKQALHDHEARTEEHPRLWMAVNQWLDRHLASLISDLPIRLLDHIESGDFGDQQYQYVVVDEFQDLSAAEQQLFFRLRADGGQFYGLGDSRQSIYRFRGNDREGLRSLDVWAERESLAVSDLPMRTCHRCPTEVVEAANRLMSLAGEEAMVATRDDPANLHVVYWDTPESEARGMAEKIVASLRFYPEGDRHLVMTTRRKFGSMLKDEIHSVDPDTSVDLSYQEGLLEAWPVREAFIFFTLLSDPDAPTWRGWFAYQEPGENRSHNAPERNSDAYLAFLDTAGDEITEERVRTLASEERTARRGRGGANLWDRAHRYVTLADRVGCVAAQDPAELVEEIFDSGFWNVRQDEERTTLDLGLLRQKSLEILEEIEDAEIGGAEAQLKELAQQLRHKIATREPFLSDETADIQITTLWGAKGVTAEHVYVVGLCDEAIPGERRDEYPGTNQEYVDEQRRLFYVSITRAKSTLILSRPQRVRYSDAKKLGLHITNAWHWVTLRATRFLRDIQAYIPEGEEGEAWTDWPAAG